MKRLRTLVTGLTLTLLFGATAAHAINVPGCGEFVLFAQDNIKMEQGATILNGDVFVQSPTGFVTVGGHNLVKGTITAHRIFLGTDAVVDNCIADVIEGPGTCTNKSIGFTPAAACTAAFPPAPLVTPIFPAACLPGTAFAVAQGATTTIPAGCYSTVRVNKNAIGLVVPGQDVFAKQEVRVLTGGTLKGDGGSATVVSKAQIITEPTVFLTDLLLWSLGGPGNNFHIGNGNILENVLAVSNVGEIHIHTGSQLRGTSELVGKVLDVQPITNEQPPSVLACTCLIGVLQPGANPFICIPE